jgi:hypothetical protein
VELRTRLLVFRQVGPDAVVVGVLQMTSMGVAEGVVTFVLWASSSFAALAMRARDVSDQ